MRATRFYFVNFFFSFFFYSFFLLFFAHPHFLALLFFLFFVSNPFVIFSFFFHFLLIFVFVQSFERVYTANNIIMNRKLLSANSSDLLTQNDTATRSKKERPQLLPPTPHAHAAAPPQPPLQHKHDSPPPYIQTPRTPPGTPPSTTS